MLWDQGKRHPCFPTPLLIPLWGYTQFSSAELCSDPRHSLPEGVCQEGASRSLADPGSPVPVPLLGLYMRPDRPRFLFHSPANEDMPGAGPSSCPFLHTDGWAMGINSPQGE